jgi:hypothetical protein
MGSSPFQWGRATHRRHWIRSADSLEFSAAGVGGATVPLIKLISANNRTMWVVRRSGYTTRESFPAPLSRVSGVLHETYMKPSELI